MSFAGSARWRTPEITSPILSHAVKACSSLLVTLSRRPSITNEQDRIARRQIPLPVHQYEESPLPKPNPPSPAFAIFSCHNLPQFPAMKFQSLNRLDSTVDFFFFSFSTYNNRRRRES